MENIFLSENNAKGKGSTMAKTQRAAFTRMDEGTKEDWAAISAHFAPFAARLPDRLMDDLKRLAGDFGGYAVDRFEHSLQTATRAFQAGRSEEYVVAALLHDVGDLAGPYNHPDIAAAILRPFVSDETHFIVEQHGVFQGYYFFHFIGLDRDAREAYRGHPHFEATAEFCEKFDQVAFDPSFESMPLAAFEPMLRRVFEKPKRSIYVKA
jgi:predicted HD phosphohydrolase